MTAEMFALLTRIRVPGASMDLGIAARQQHLLPLVGLVVGIVATLAAILLQEFLGTNMVLVSGGLVLVLLYYVNGMLHTEGLSDFADGLMAKGTPEEKRAVMKDVHSGVGGVFTTVLFLLVFYALVTTICSEASSEMSTSLLPWPVTVAAGLVIAEMAGKLAIVTAAYMGPSAHAGMGSLFVDEANATKLTVAVLIAAVAAAVLSGFLFPLVLTGVVAGALVTIRARREFGGVSGDVFGAANELGRLAALLGWVLLI